MVEQDFKPFGLDLEKDLEKNSKKYSEFSSIYVRINRRITEIIQEELDIDMYKIKPTWSNRMLVNIHNSFLNALIPFIFKKIDSKK